MVIGRDGNTSQLNVAVGQRIYRFFAPDSVPSDVSRQHCLVSVKGEDDIVVRNIKAANVTFVNGVEIEEKHITCYDKIELGKSRYFLNLPHIIASISPAQQTKQKPFGIKPLKAVWDNYIKQDLLLQKRHKNIGLLSSIPMGFTMLGGVLAGVIESIRPYSIAFTVAALAVMVYGFYKRATDDTLEKRQQLKQDFQRKYVCPNPECRHFMGNTPYDSLLDKGTCPYCKATFEDS